METAYKERRQPMKYTREQRLEIGKQIFEKKINKEEAAMKYGISAYTARDYYRMYKAWLKEQQEASD